DARGCARRVEDGAAPRTRRGRPAVVQSINARGSQPGRCGPPLRAPLLPDGDRGRQPRQGRHRPRRAPGRGRDVRCRAAERPGGVQKEAYFFGVPCVTLRDETEWIETVEDGWNALVGTDTADILDAIEKFNPSGTKSKSFGDGHAAEKIALILDKFV